MLQNIFSHRPPLYDVFDKAELYALHAPCIVGISIALDLSLTYAMISECVL